MIYIILPLFLLYILIFLFTLYYTLKSKKLFFKNYRIALEKQGKTKGLLDFMDYIKTRNPKGGFVNPKKMIENLSSKDDTEEIKKILEEIYKFNLKTRQGLIVSIIVFVLLLSAVIINNLIK